MVVSSVLIDAPLDVVWKAITDFPSHVEWMGDAESIHFESESTGGVGTRVQVATRVGPFRTRDRLEITAWAEGRMIAARHIGTVRGEGRFELDPMAGGTRLRWREHLSFPLRLGGPVTTLVARPLLRWIWRRNLHALRHRLENP